MTSDIPVPRVTFGQGPRPALALHCTLAHAGAWRAMGAALSETHTLSAIDLPGHGNNPPWNGPGDLHDACTEAAQAVLSEPMDVIGHSFGATVALRLAIEHADKVRSLTMIEPVLFAAVREEAPDELDKHLKDAQPYLSALDAGDMAQAARLFNRIWGDGTRWDDFRETARRYMTDRIYQIPLQTPALFEDRARLLVPERIARVTMPSLLIAGSESPSVARSICSVLTRRLPNARMVMLAGAGHMAPLTHPQEVAHAVTRLGKVA